MKLFQSAQIDEAIAYALSGEQALHVHSIIVDESKAPSCFVRDVRQGKEIAHLFDQDIKRLRHTASCLGVKIIVVEHEGASGQHVDLCGYPLRLARGLCIS